MSEVHDAALRCAIDRILAMRIQARHRGRVDDRAATAFLHDGCGDPGPHDYGGEIDVDDTPQLRQRGLRKWRNAGSDASIVVKDIEAAELLDRRIDHFARVGFE